MTLELTILAVFFGIVVLGVTGVGYMLVLRPAANRAAGAGAAAPGLKPGNAGEATIQASLMRTFRLVGEAFPAARVQDSRSRKRLAQAGFRSASAPQIFFGIRYAGGLFLAGLAGSLAFEAGQEVTGILLAALCAGGFGFLLPDRVLEILVRRRAERIRRALPATLDLLVLGLEAGQSMDQAMIETSRSLSGMHPELSSELLRVHMEARASKSRTEAFRHLAERNQQPDLLKVVNLLIDSDRFGTSIAPALRTHARYLRTRFRQRAQESARKVSVKLVFPVFFLILPSVLLVTLGPAVLQMQSQLNSIIGDK